MAGKHYVGKYETRKAAFKKSHKTRQRTVLISILLILSLAVGGTLAYLAAKTDHIRNQFEPVLVTSQVNANEDGSFDVTNTGDVDAYIRAAISVNWMDDTDAVRGIAPTTADYQLTVNTTDWRQDTTTGYYYYKSSVSPDATTEDLVTSFAILENAAAPDGYQLCVEVTAEAIQADGDTDAGAVPAYQDAWKITSISGS